MLITLAAWAAVLIGSFITGMGMRERNVGMIARGAVVALLATIPLFAYDLLTMHEYLVVYTGFVLMGLCSGFSRGTPPAKQTRRAVVEPAQRGVATPSPPTSAAAQVSGGRNFSGARPESRASEAGEPIGHAYLRGASDIWIKYRDRNGTVSERVIRPDAVTGPENNGIMTLQKINAFCLLRQDKRIFFLERIETAADATTGELIDIAEWISARIDQKTARPPQAATAIQVTPSGLLTIGPIRIAPAPPAATAPTDRLGIAGAPTLLLRYHNNKGEVADHLVTPRYIRTRERRGQIGPISLNAYCHRIQAHRSFAIKQVQWAQLSDSGEQIDLVAWLQDYIDRAKAPP